MNGEHIRQSVVHAGIAAGMAFFAFLVGLQVAAIRADPVTAALGAFVAAGFAFFTRLAGAVLPGPPMAGGP